MFRPASRTILRHANASATHQQLRFAQARRFVSTSAKTEKSRSWKNSALRWGLAVGAVYYYNTSSVFAEDPELALQKTSAQQNENAPLPTIESVAAAKKQRAAALAAEAAAARKQEAEPEPRSEPEPANEHESDAAAAADVEVAPTESQPLLLTPGELEEEADQQGAFNPETGEINWDCPCLGGMAHGPCGEEFKEAFSCFVYSTEEPKGMDCIEKFKGMQDCFRLHPDIYGGELDEDEVDEQLKEHIAAEDAAAAAAATETSAAGSPVDVEAMERKQVKQDIEKDLDAADTIQTPEKWHDATHKNAEAEQEKKKQ